MNGPLILGGPVNFGPTAAGLQLVGGGFLLLGWAAEETTLAAVARLILRDGASAAGQYLVPITLGSGESRADDAPGGAVLFESGLFVDVTAGTVAGTLWVAPTYEVVRQGQLVRVVEDRYGGLVPITYMVPGSDAYSTAGVTP